MMAGKVTITTTIDWPTSSSQLARAAGLGPILEGHEQRIVKMIQAPGGPPGGVWAWDTGASNRRWRGDTVFGPEGGIDVVISNDAEYVEYVHRKGNPSDNVLENSVIPAIRDMVPAMVADVQAALAAHLAKPTRRRKVTP